MKKFSKALDYLTIIKYSFIFFLFLIFNNLEKDVLPYSTAIFITAISLDYSVFPTSALFLLSFLVLNKVGLIPSMAIVVTIFIIVFAVYKKYKIRIRFEFIAYTALSLIGFILLGDTNTEILYEKRFLTSLLILLLTTVSMIAGNALVKKGLKYKLGFEEFATIAILCTIAGVGLSNFISPYVTKALAIITIFIFSYIYKTGISTLISSVLGISLALYYNQINYVSIFLLYGITVQSLMPVSRRLASVSVLAVDYLINAIFLLNERYIYSDFICMLVAIFLFWIIPNNALKQLKEKLYSFRERQLVRQTINRNRTLLSGKLFDLSTVFSEMASAFEIFKKVDLSEGKAKEIIKKQLHASVCRQCDNYPKCKAKENYISTSISSMLDIGFAKGKLSLIDFPLELSNLCIHPNDMLYNVNKSLANYRAQAIENANLNSGRELIALQSKGVSEILRGLALESGQQLKYNNRLERFLCDNLYKCGILVQELLIFGEDDNISISLIVTMHEFSIEKITNIISKSVNKVMFITDKAQISDEKCYLLFKKAVDYDAVFGLATVTKDGSIMSGDTHSISRIKENKFLLALSDGMGSGKDAQTISNTSLSLIESFYKAGLSTPLILNTVNKLLSINTEDSFTALDIAVIDLNTASADFIKYGSPYGFIIGNDGIKIVEGNSLPLGIIDNLKPAVCTTQLNDGDIILVVTDGVSDAFNSSSEIIDFLRTQPAKNPQTLVDNLMTYALEKTCGVKNDDMTALAVRVFKK